MANGQEITRRLAQYERGTVAHQLNTWSTEVHMMRVDNLSDWRALYQLLLDSNRLVTLEYGVSHGGQIDWQLPESRYVYALEADGSSASASQAGFLVTMTTVDPLYTLDVGRSVQAWSGRLDDSIAGLMSGYDLPITVEPVDNRAVSLIQAFQSDYDFLVERILPRMANTSNVTGYVVYFRDNQFWAHTPCWTMCRGWSTKVGSDIPVSNFTAQDRLGKSRIDGRDGTHIVAYDPFSGETARAEDNQNLMAKFAPATWPYTVNQYDGVHIGQNGLADERSKFQYMVALARIKAAGAAITVVNEPGLSVGDRLNVSLPGPDPAQGDYWVCQINSTLTAGNMQTIATLIRGEVKLSGTAPGTPLPQVTQADANMIQVLSPG